MLAPMPRLTVTADQRAGLESWTRTRTLSHRRQPRLASRNRARRDCDNGTRELKLVPSN